MKGGHMNIKDYTTYTFKPKVKLNETISFKTTPGMKATIKKIAKDNNTTMSDIINQTLLNFLMDTGHFDS